MSESELYVAKEGATFDWNGQPVFITAGVTIVRAGHPILAGHEELFQPLRIHYDHRPEDGLPVNTNRADMRGARTRSAIR